MLPKPLPTDDLKSILTQTAPLWEEARGRSFFVTGGTGFFGCWLVESFCDINRALDLGAQMVVLTRNRERFAAKCPHVLRDAAVVMHEGDIRDFEFPDRRFDYVIHAATDTSAKIAAQAPEEIFATIVDGTRRALQFAEVGGARKFLLTSSGAIYGKQPPDLTHVPEGFSGSPNPLDPSSSYGEGKRAAELLCAFHSSGRDLECKIARCWAFCGPHLPLDQHFAIGNFIGDVLAGRLIEIRGDGTPRRSYLYAADLTVWLWTILFKAPSLVPFNVGSAHDVSIRELAQTVVAALDSESEIRIAQEPREGVPPLRYVPCVDRARDVLGLTQTVGLSEMIRRTAKWHERQN